MPATTTDAFADILSDMLATLRGDRRSVIDDMANRFRADGAIDNGLARQLTIIEGAITALERDLVSS